MMVYAFALLGLAYGVVLQRTGFCFARAAFELLMLRTRDALDGVMAGLLVGTVGFGVVTLARQHQHSGAVGHEHLLVLPAGAGTIVGGTLFGLGMMLAGMCAAGTLLRLGEGYASAWAALAGVIGGAALDPFRALRPGLLLAPGQGVWLGDWVHPAAAFAASAGLLGVIWLWVARTRVGPAGAPEAQPWAAKLRAFLAPAVVGGLTLGALNAVQVLVVATPWTVGYPLALVPSLWSRGVPDATVRAALPLLLLDGCIVLGALLSAAVGGELRFRVPKRRREMGVALVGGVLMGIGIQTAHGCNIGGVFSAIPSLSLSGWLYLPAIVIGAWVGGKLVVRLA